MVTLTTESQLRVVLSSVGDISISAIETNAVPLSSLFPTSLYSLIDRFISRSAPNFRVFVSSEPTKPSLFTKHKTSRRKHYNNLRAKLPFKKDHTGFPEVLLFNCRNEIMEGSICTPYFLRGGHWITPHVSCGGNVGTTRRYALEHGLCKEGIVLKDSIRIGELVVLSNGVRGFGCGIVENLP
jgi:4-amino-4-deoxychorismate lyase